MARRASTFASVALSAFHAPGLSGISWERFLAHRCVLGLALRRDGGREGQQLTNPRFRQAYSHEASTCAWRHVATHICGFNSCTCGLLCARLSYMHANEGPSGTVSPDCVADVASPRQAPWLSPSRWCEPRSGTTSEAGFPHHANSQGLLQTVQPSDPDDLADKSPEQVVEDVEVLQLGNFHLPVCQPV